MNTLIIERFLQTIDTRDIKPLNKKEGFWTLDTAYLYPLICQLLSASSTELTWAASLQNQQKGLSAQSDQSLPSALWVAEDPMFLYADSENCDQPWRIWVFAGRTGYFVGIVMRWLT